MFPESRVEFGVESVKPRAESEPMTGTVIRASSVSAVKRLKGWRSWQLWSRSREHQWVQAVQKHVGLLEQDTPFILVIHIQLILLLQRDTLKHLQDATIVVMGTVCTLRAMEIARLDVCDLRGDIDWPDTLALLLW